MKCRSEVYWSSAAFPTAHFIVIMKEHQNLTLLNKVRGCKRPLKARLASQIVIATDNKRIRSLAETPRRPRESPESIR